MAYFAYAVNCEFCHTDLGGRLSLIMDVLSEGIMQEYYIKKAKECEAAVAVLQSKIEQMSKSDTATLQVQMVKVRREMNNYKKAVDKAAADV